jgi:hypothetical protein
MITPTPNQLDHGFKFVRAEANKAGPVANMVPDDKLKAFVAEFATVILNADPPKSAA